MLQVPFTQPNHLLKKIPDSWSRKMIFFQHKTTQNNQHNRKIAAKVQTNLVIRTVQCAQIFGWCVL